MPPMQGRCPHRLHGLPLVRVGAPATLYLWCGDSSSLALLPFLPQADPDRMIRSTFPERAPEKVAGRHARLSALLT